LGWILKKRRKSIMIIFHSYSRDNVGRALVDHVWQSKDMPDPSRFSEGDPVFLKANDIDGIHAEIFYLGVADRITREPLHPWPDAWREVRDPDSVPTIYTRPVHRDDFGKRQGPFNYKAKVEAE
jgi:hypothetical protein